MGNNGQTFEVDVEVPIKGSRHFSPHVGMYIENKRTKLYHIDARTHKQAKQKAKKYGRPVGCRKVDIDKIGGNIEDCLLKPSNPYPNAVAMDEFIWKKKDKRAERLNNNARHKNGY